ncbi:MAG TPA: GNVR domain-containing protein [Dissulfurispiraceae bacterium]|nr:GNVR domain-containing protein [Dissulfurispiraceae bacterium]
MEPNEQLNIRRNLLLLAQNKRLFAATAIAIMSLFLVVSFVIPRKYEAKSTVFIERSVISDLIKGMAITPSMEDRLRVLQYTMLSRTLLAKVVEDLDLNPNKADTRKTDELVLEFQKGTIVKTKEDRRETDLFTVSYKGSNPKVASDFVNMLIRRYVEENVASKREESFGATRFMDEQIAHFKEKLDKAETELAAFVQEKGVRAAGQGERRSGTVRDKAQILESRLSDLQLRYTDTHPDIVRLKAEIAEMKTRPSSERFLVSEAGASVSGSLEETTAGRDGRRYSLRGLLPEDKAKLIALDRERESFKTTLDELAGRLNKSELSKQMQIQDKSATFRIIDPAIPSDKPASPNRVIIILLGIASGIVGGVGIIVLRDQMNSSVRSVDTLKSFGLPVLAIIPRVVLAADLEAQRKKDLRVYQLSVVFGVFLCVMLILEAVGYSPIDFTLDQMNFGLADIKGMVRKVL